MPGLEISSREFLKLPQKQQNLCLYENQVETLKSVKSYRFHQKIQYPWLIALSGSAFFIFKQIVNLT